MDRKAIMVEINLAAALIEGAYAADPLYPDDAGCLAPVFNCLMKVLDKSLPGQAALTIAIASAYSLGARHALERLRLTEEQLQEHARRAGYTPATLQFLLALALPRQLRHPDVPNQEAPPACPTRKEEENREQS